MEVALTGATLINGDNTNDFSWWTAPASPDPISVGTGAGALQSGRNYLELQLTEEDGTPLQRAFWDPTANSGDGVEFTQEVNTVTELFVTVVINQTGFHSGDPDLIPLAIVDVDGSFTIQGIQDKRELFFRLGSPDDNSSGYTWGTRVEPTTLLTFDTPSGTAYTAGETITFSSGATATVVTGGTDNLQVISFSSPNFNIGDTVTGGSSGGSAALATYYESFTGADKDIQHYRDMFAALMNEIRLIKGTDFWFEAGGALSLPTVLNYINSWVVPIATGARWEWDGSNVKLTDNLTSGQASSDVIAAIRVPGYSSNLNLTRQDGEGGSASIGIPDQSLLYVELPTAGSNRTFSEAGSGTTNFRVIDRGAFVPTDNKFILAYREGSKLIIWGGGELDAGEVEGVGQEVPKALLAFIGAASETDASPPYTETPSANLSNQFNTGDSLVEAISINAANINDIAAALLKPYQEQMEVVSGSPADDNEIQATVTAGTTVTIPLDSRDSNVQKQYVVGSGSLMIYLNGQELINGEDYTEIGSAGALSSTVQFAEDLELGDFLDFRILTPQYFGTTGDSQPFYVNYIIGQNGTQVPVGALYNLGDDKLVIWRNGLFMFNSSSVGDTILRYQEATANSVSLTQTANPSEIFAFANFEDPSPAITYITGVTGTVITVPTYTVGNAELIVFKNGKLLSLDASAPTSLKYSETSTTSITLDTAAIVSDTFAIYIAGTPPTWRHSLTGTTGSTLTVPGGDSFVNGNQKLLVFRNGYFMYNSTVLGNADERYQENGTTQVDLDEVAVSGDLFEFIRI